MGQPAPEHNKNPFGGLCWWWGGGLFPGPASSPMTFGQDASPPRLCVSLSADLLSPCVGHMSRLRLSFWDHRRNFSPCGVTALWTASHFGTSLFAQTSLSLSLCPMISDNERHQLCDAIGRRQDAGRASSAAAKLAALPSVAAEHRWIRPLRVPRFRPHHVVLVHFTALCPSCPSSWCPSGFSCCCCCFWLHYRSASHKLL